MKGKILWTTLLLVAVLSVTFQLHFRKNHLENLLLENMEALAAGEWGTGFNCRWTDYTYLHCYPWGKGLGCPCFM